MSTTLSDKQAAGQIKLQLARAFIKKEHPYFYRPLIGLIPKDVPDIGTLFVTDTMILGVDMAWFSTNDVDVAGGCLIHEVSHVLRDLGRIRNMCIQYPGDEERIGRAFDIPLNDDLRKFGIKLPEWAIYSDTYKFPPGLTGEAYYHLLKDIPAPKICSVGSGKCGSCNGGKDPKKFEDEPGRSEKEVQYFKKIGAQDIRDFIRSKKMKPGDYPGSWEEFLNYDDEKPIVPWQRLTKTTSGMAYGRITQGHSDYSMRRPAKRSYTTGVVRPGLIDYEPNVYIIEDSSASMGTVQLKENRVELAAAMLALGIQTVWFLNADVKVQTKPKKITVQELLKIPVTGRGGTDFRPAIELVMKCRPRPDLIYYSTDGDGQAPEKKPARTEFIWLLAPGPYTRKPCNWGTQILTTNDPGQRKEFELLK